MDMVGHNEKPSPCCLYRRMIAMNWLWRRLQRDGLDERAGDGTRTRDSLLGRQSRTKSLYACSKSARGANSYNDSKRYAQKRQELMDFTLQLSQQ